MNPRNIPFCCTASASKKTAATSAGARSETTIASPNRGGGQNAVRDVVVFVGLPAAAANADAARQ